MHIIQTADGQHARLETQKQPLPWGILATLVWLFLALVVSAVMAVAVGASLGQLSREVANRYDGVLVTVGTLTSVPIEVALLAVAARLRRWPAANYLALNVPRRCDAVVAVFCAIALVAVFDALLVLTGNDIVTPFQMESYHSAVEAGWLPLLFLAVVIFAPVGEEIAFRGFLYRGLVRHCHEIHAIIIVSLVWSLLHIQYNWIGVAQIFLFGLLFGWFRWTSGSTTVTILMHVVVNLEAMIETIIKMEVVS